VQQLLLPLQLVLQVLQLVLLVHIHHQQQLWYQATMLGSQQLPFNRFTPLN
jgi:hypothetical protein